MTQKERAQAEQLKQQEDIRAALKQTGVQQEGARPVAETSDKVWFGGYVFLLIGFGAINYLVTLSFFGLSQGAIGVLQRFARGAMLLDSR